ncbi:MAG: fumarylacetoacetate hydrolase family protein [Proteobacteria bacterium]|nr:fumarylacetoacetate hydrolase family protein [Pseudomonadota bacterium]MDA0994773.1 fumarylacetoacetate hydrolase family protein [Pseudomonadota bacterium]
MKLGTIRVNGRETVIGRVDDSNAVALESSTMEDLIAGGDHALDDARKAIDKGATGVSELIDVTTADWMAPNPRASKIIGCAANNNKLNEVAYRPMKSPMFFMKGRSALTGHNKPIRILSRHGRTIPEPEPVIMFKSTAKNVGEDDILDHVFGYTLTNDCTASGIKFGEDSIALNQKPELISPHHMEWRHRFEDDNYIYFIYHARSKASDTFAAMGPWLTTADEIDNPNNMRMKGYIDGDLYADDSTANYFFSVERVLSEASTWFTIEPGDCVHCGTAVKGNDKFPEGNLGIDLRLYSITDVEIDGLGRLSNPIIADPF